LRPFESRWDRVFPYVLGILFGLSVALTVSSVIILKRALSIKREAGKPVAGFVTGSIEAERSDAIVRATRIASPSVVSITSIRTKLVQAYPLLSYEWFRRV